MDVLKPDVLAANVAEKLGRTDTLSAAIAKKLPEIKALSKKNLNPLFQES